MPENDNSPIRIVLAEDHAIVRQGFLALLNNQPDMEVCAEADSSTSTQESLQTCTPPPDILIMDLVLKGEDGLDLIKQVNANYPELPILIISMREEEVYAERCIRAGASGFIMKSQPGDEFIRAVHTVLSGEFHVSPPVQAQIVRRHFQKSIQLGGSDQDKLSDRELHVYHKIGEGRATRDIAKEMGISPKTVEAHREHIKKKLGLNNAAELRRSAQTWVDHKYSG